VLAASSQVHLLGRLPSRDSQGSDAYPVMAERGYGWEKLMSEVFCQENWSERRSKTFIARFHNVYGPYGTWDGGREKAPAARK
jgi:GDP-D-mannose 3',5'-epimerase